MLSSFLRRAFALILLVSVFMPGAAHALSVQEARFGNHEGQTRLVLELSDSVPYRVFVLSDPYRMVIDMPEFDWQAGNVDYPAASGIKAVRQGVLEAGISRIVFDLKNPIAISDAFTLARSGNLPERLVIDFAASSPAAFEKEKARIHGALSAGGVKNLGQSYTSAPATQASAAPGMITPARKPEGSASPAPVKKAHKPVIVIDPGHGGNDPGAIGSNKSFEKTVVLGLARELKRQLESTGDYKVLMTRDSDTYIKLSQRVAFARKNGADLFISLHADSISDPKVRGLSVYTLSEKASDSQTARLAARENRSDIIAGVDLSVEDEDVASILVDLAMRDTMNQSKFFANKLVDTIRGSGPRILENPHRYAGFAVLKAPDIPSVLVEAGFMSNGKEAEMLASADYRSKLAAALKKGIVAYFEHVKKNDRS